MPIFRRNAFTLLELLLVIAIIATLISLVIPSLGQMKTRADELGNLSEIASHARTIQLYTTENRDAFPSLVPVGATTSTYFVGGEPYTIQGYFGQVYAWHFGLAPAYYDDQMNIELFKRAHRDPWLVSDYRLTASIMADPAFWNYATRTGPSQWRGQRVPGVRYPSAKVLLADDRIMDGHGLTPEKGVIALMDLSAISTSQDQIAAPFPPGEGEWPGTWSSGRPGIHTVDGILGRDIQP